MIRKKSRVEEGANPPSRRQAERSGARSDAHPEAHADLHDLIEENEQRLYDFASYLLYGMVDVDELILSIFREFGEAFHKRKRSNRDGLHQLPRESRLQLFHMAWERIREILSRNAYAWSAGRDTRSLKGLDEDILGYWGNHQEDWQKIDAAVLERLSRIDPDFRTPLVLRDVLRFEDDEVIQILGLRWGVYRHRLHRGRLEFCEALRGAAATPVKMVEASRETPTQNQ